MKIKYLIGSNENELISKSKSSDSIVQVLFAMDQIKLFCLFLLIAFAIFEAKAESKTECQNRIKAAVEELFQEASRKILNTIFGAKIQKVFYLFRYGTSRSFNGSEKHSVPLIQKLSRKRRIPRIPYFRDVSQKTNFLRFFEDYFCPLKIILLMF